MGDIGVYVVNLVEYVFDFEIIEFCVDLNYVVEGWVFDDDGIVLFRFNNGCKGVLLVS